MAKPLTDSPVLKLTENALWLAERQPTGFLVALWLNSDIAEKLALAGGEAADSLHITLAFCGDVAEMGELLQAQAISAVNRAVRYWNPLEGKISGYGRFNASESSDSKDVFYATPDIPQLSDLRQCIVNCLMDEGVAVSTNHGYTPHITLAYLDSEAENPVDQIESLDLKFTGVTIMAGTRRVDIPFWLETYPESTISMSEQADLPIEAPLGAKHYRALFSSFDKDWIPFLPVPGTYNHEVFGTMDLTSEAYDQMIQNFDDYVYKQDLPIRATHMPSDGGAIGWIKPGGMRKASDGSLEVKPEWNELGQGLVDGDRFRYVSAEFCKEWTNPVTQEKIKNVAVGLALVTRPHFKTDVLNPLSESEALAFAEATSSNVLAGSTGEGTQVTEEEKAAAAAAAKLAEDQAAEAAAAKLTEDARVAAANAAAQTITLNNLSDVVITAQQRIEERQKFADLTVRAELAERRATAAEASMSAMQHQRRLEKFTAEVTGRSAENGTAWFGNVQDNVTHLVSLAESHGDDSAEVRWAVTQKRNEAQAIRQTKLFDPISLGGGDTLGSVTVQVAHLAEQLKAQDKNLTDDAAINLVYKNNPELYIRTIQSK